jgi:hypothetical protein
MPLEPNRAQSRAAPRARRALFERAFAHKR